MKAAILSLLAFLTTLCNAQILQPYTSFQGAALNLYKWEGSKVMLLSSSDTLNASVMTNWVTAMDAAFNYYTLCNGREPIHYRETYINNRSTIADVSSTCGAGCGYLGFTGIEIQNAYFNNIYNRILNDNQYDQIPFYEFGRNFWFYDSKLKYQTNDPVVTGYAVFMRFMSMEYIGVNGAPFNGTLPFNDFKNQIRGLLNSYLTNASLNWNNTLGSGQGVPGSGWGASDLFATFCFYLKENYGGHNWVQNVWKYAELRPNATNTQGAVDNFIISSSQAANTNLASLFQSWRWPVSANAINTLILLFPTSTPVKLISFKAFTNGCDSATLNWRTAQEINNKGFDIEQSNDGNHFYKIGFTAGKINSSIDQTYNFTLDKLTGGQHYFRLRQIDVGGNFEYSPIVYINNSCSKNSIAIFPNPSKNMLHISGLTNNKNNIKLVNALGITVANRTITSQGDLDISSLKKGIYFLIVNGKDYKLIKE